MLTSEARVETEHPGRYLTQLCKHASKMGGNRLHRPRRHAGGGEPPEMRSAEWSGADGTVTLNWGQWTMHAAAGTLTLRAEADGEENLRRIQDLVTARLQKIGRRDHLTVNWQPADAPAGRPGEASLLPGDAACRVTDMASTELNARRRPHDNGSNPVIVTGEGVRRAARPRPLPPVPASPGQRKAPHRPGHTARQLGKEQLKTCAGRVGGRSSARGA